MAYAFEILAGFLDRFAPEVEGRAQIEPSDEIRRKLRAFARGELTQAEREQLVDLLRENPQWAAILADEVKALRSSSESEKGHP